MIRIIIVDDHPIFRRGLMSLVEKQKDMEVVAESDGSDLIELCQTIKPDIVSLDINLPGADGFELACQIRKLSDEIKIIFVSMFNSTSYIRTSFKCGASGHIPKDAAVEDFIRVIKVVNGGGLFFPREIFNRDFAESENGLSGQLRFHLLTKREKEVARLFGGGLGYKEIAVELELSPKTIEAHRVNILKKTGCRNIQQFVKRGVQEGLF